MEIGEIAGTQQVHGADAAIGLARIALQSVHAGKLPTADQCGEGEPFAPPESLVDVTWRHTLRIKTATAKAQGRAVSGLPSRRSALWRLRAGSLSGYRASSDRAVPSGRPLRRLPLCR